VLVDDRGDILARVDVLPIARRPVEARVNPVLDLRGLPGANGAASAQRQRGQPLWNLMSFRRSIPPLTVTSLTSPIPRT